jgi:hypothetical protein
MPGLRVALMVLLLGALGAGATPGKAEPAKLATDAAVRSGMLAIRDLVRLNHSLVTHRRMPPDHAQRFAKAIGAQADTILATSTISGAAKERLAALLAEVTAGVEAVAHPERGVAPMDGLVRVDEALARYPQEFDHPGWAPVQSLE